MFAKWDWAMPWAIRLGIPVVIIGWSSYFPTVHTALARACVERPHSALISGAVSSLVHVERHRLDYQSRNTASARYQTRARHSRAAGASDVVCGREEEI